MSLLDSFNRNKINENDEYIDSNEYESEGTNNKISVKIVIILTLLLMVVSGSIGGYSIYNNTNYKYDTNEIVDKLKNMQANLSDLEDTVSANATILTELEMSDANIEGYSEGIVSSLRDIDSSISNTEIDISQLISNLEEGDIKNKEQYNELIERYNEINNSMNTVNDEMNETLNDISVCITNLSSDGNYDYLKNKLEDIYYDLSKIDIAFKDSLDEQLGFIGSDIEKLGSNINELSKSNEENYNKLSEELEVNNSLLKSKLDTSQEMINGNQEELINQITNNHDNILSTISTNQDTIINQITNNQGDLINTISNNQENLSNSLLNNQQNLINSISENQTSLINSISINQASIYDLMVDNNQSLEELIRKECDKVFQCVTNDKYILASALVTKYDMANASWIVDGEDVRNIVNEACNNTDELQGRNLYVAERISFADMMDAINNMPLEIKLEVTDTYVPGDITYKYHYHTDENGNIVEEEKSDEYGGCFTVEVVHYHDDSCYVPPVKCGGLLVHSYREGSGNGTHVCDRNSSHRWTGNCLGSGTKCKVGSFSCSVVLKNGYYKCGYSDGEVLYYEPACGLTNGQITEANIVWVNSETGISK